MKTSWNSIIVSLSSTIFLLFSAIEVSESCSYSYRGEDYRVAFFSPTLLNDEIFEPFYYTSASIYSNDANFETDKVRNCQLWQTELGQNVKLADIEKILYDGDSDTIVNAYNEKKLIEFYPNNSFVKSLLKRENKAILEYFVTTKQNEFINFAEENPWGFYDAEFTYDESKERQEIINEIDEKLVRTKNTFLKKRYAYLQIVNYRYSAEKAKAIPIFEKYFNTNENDVLTAWAIFHTASCLKDKVKSNYYLSLAFDKCDSKKIRCHYGFVNDSFEATLELAQNDSEKATIFALTGIDKSDRTLDLIEQTYRLDKHNRNINALIVREISKIEDWLLTSKVTGLAQSVEPSEFNFYGKYDYSKEEKVMIEAPQMYRNEISWNNNYFNLKNYQKDLKYAADFRSFLIKFLNQEIAERNKDFLRLVISHLYFLTDKPQKAIEYNRKVVGNSPKIQAQKAINNILLSPLTKDILSTTSKKNLYKELTFLQNNLKHFDNPLQTISQLHLYLSRMYMRKGDKVTAGFLHQKTSFTGKNETFGSTYYFNIAFFDRFANVAEVQKAIDLLAKKNKSDFEDYILTQFTEQELNYYDYGAYEADYYKENRRSLEERKLALFDLKGTIAFRQNDLKVALKAFEQLPSNYWETRYAFQAFLNQDPFSDEELDLENPVAINKVKLVQKLLELQEKAIKEKDVSAYLALGKAYSSFTYWGSNWMMFSYGKYINELDADNKLWYGTYTFYPNAEKYFDVYYGLGRSKQYAQKALELSTDINIQAEAAFMIAWANKYEERALSIKEDRERKDIDFFAAWTEKYAEAAAFDQLSYCAY